MKVLADYNTDELKELAKSFSQPSFRGGQLFKWVADGADYGEMSDIPKSFREDLAKEYCAVPLSEVKTLCSADKSKKYLFKLHDGNLIECVYMPHSYGNTVCASTQVGCRMGCTFCASGKNGLERNLTAGEILYQIIAANKAEGGTRTKRAVHNVVLMGSGEPLDNYDNVTKFIKLATDENGLNIGQRYISLSTCGICENIVRLADEGYGVTLSVSLHATTDEYRKQVMPIANKYTISDIMHAVRYYFDKTGRRVIFEYALIKDVNMNYFDAKRLAELTKGFASHVNLIMLNKVDGKNIAGCTRTEAERFMKRLNDFGVSASIRKSSGQDIGGACGQLRGRYINDGKND